MPVKRSTIYLLPYRDKVLRLTDGDKRRFKKKLKERDECLVWSGGLDRNGYGIFYVPRYKICVLAHRAAWVFAGNEITPDKPFVLHDCPERDDHACCSAAHLWTGTHGDNARDYKWKNGVRSLSYVRVWPQRSKPDTHHLPMPPAEEEVKEVKLLGLPKRPTEAQIFGRKPRISTHRRTCAELREARKLQWLAKKHQKEVDKAARKRAKEAREERRKERQERKEVLGY